MQAGSGIIGSVINAIGQGKRNRRAEAFTREFYDKQSVDAYNQWQRENVYNSPAEQMKRLKAAGLNPNLVYGNGATATGGSMNTPNPKDYNPEATTFDTSPIQDGIGTYVDIRMKNTQADLLQEQMDLLQKEQTLKEIQGLSMIADIDTKKFDLGQRKELNSSVIEAAKLNLDKMVAEISKTKTDTMYTLNQDERAAALNQVTVKKAIEEILTMRLGRAKTKAEIAHIQQQISNLKTDKASKEYDLHKKRTEISPTNFLDLIGKYFNDDNAVKRVQREAQKARDSWKGEDTMDYKKLYHLK